MCCGAIYWSRISRVVFGCSAIELGVVAGGSLVMPSRQVFASGTRRVEVVGPSVVVRQLVYGLARAETIRDVLSKNTGSSQDGGCPQVKYRIFFRSSSGARI